MEPNRWDANDQMLIVVIIRCFVEMTITSPYPLKLSAEDQALLIKTEGSTEPLEPLKTQVSKQGSIDVLLTVQHLHRFANASQLEK